MLDPTDEGKRVVTPRGETLGTVDRVRDGTAYVRPTTDVVAGFGPRPARSWYELTYELDEDAVEGIVDDTVVLAPDDTDAVVSRP